MRFCLCFFLIIFVIDCKKALLNKTIEQDNLLTHMKVVV